MTITAVKAITVMGLALIAAGFLFGTHEALMFGAGLLTGIPASALVIWGLQKVFVPRRS